MSSVHPRDRGEHGRPISRESCSYGSSPRSRGTLQGERTAADGTRFIPAIAGNTGDSEQTLDFRSVHPRDRGEHSSQSRESTTSVGSSPRSRGTLRSCGRYRQRVRFIPAIAGNTKRASSSRSLITVHPRDRGEHRATSGSSSRPGGSSPRSRGTLQVTGPHERKARFIPAIAGNTAAGGARFVQGPVHPRDRGEHGQARRPGGLADGSSPRSRGTLFAASAGLLLFRFIPAIAGNTLITTPCYHCL